MANAQRILGIDPGFGRVGFGVIEQIGDRTWHPLTYGCIETKPKSRFLDRLTTIHAELTALISAYQPTRLAVEELFFFNNATTAMDVGQARGVILLTGHSHGLAIDEFTPLEVKQAITGYGRAEKDQVEKMVRMILGIPKKIRPDDAADALAIALTAAQTLWMKKFD